MSRCLHWLGKKWITWDGRRLRLLVILFFIRNFWSFFAAWGFISAALPRRISCTILIGFLVFFGGSSCCLWDFCLCFFWGNSGRVVLGGWTLDVRCSCLFNWWRGSSYLSGFVLCGSVGVNVWRVSNWRTLLVLDNVCSIWAWFCWYFYIFVEGCFLCACITFLWLRRGSYFGWMTLFFVSFSKGPRSFGTTFSFFFFFSTEAFILLLFICLFGRTVCERVSRSNFLRSFWGVAIWEGAVGFFWVLFRSDVDF